MNNNGNNNGASLLEKIRALAFVKAELELYLDTHPTCKAALEYYAKTVDELTDLTDDYEDNYGPLCAGGVRTEKGWTWVDTPWPWQHGNGRAKEEKN